MKATIDPAGDPLATTRPQVRSAPPSADAADPLRSEPGAAPTPAKSDAVPPPGVTVGRTRPAQAPAGPATVPEPLRQPPPSDRDGARRAGGRGVLWAVLLLLALAAGGGWYYWYEWRPAQLAKASPAPAAASGRIPGAAPAASTAPAVPGARPAGPAPTPVVAVAARSEDLPITLDALGTVVPTQTVAVKSRVSGLLERVLFKEGDLVKEGQLLAEIDPRELKVQLAQAEGQLARDRALLENARVDLQRYETLFKQDSIARQQVDTQRALVRQYDGLIRVDQSQVENARLQLSYAKVTAPISGRAGLRQVDAGNMVTGAEVNGLVVITQVEPISVVFAIPQDELPKVLRRMGTGDTLPVKALDRTQQNELATGRLVSIDNLIDPATGTIKLKAEFPNHDGQLFPNQFVNARLELDLLRNAVTVPSSAIQRGSQGLFVYVVKANRKVELRPVTLGPVDGQRLAIASGITPGEMVVIDGIDRLREGATVELIERPDFSAPPPPKPAPARRGSNSQRASPQGTSPQGARPEGATPQGDGAQPRRPQAQR